MCLGCCRPGFKAQKVLPAPVLKIIVLPVIIRNTLDFFDDYFTGKKISDVDCSPPPLYMHMGLYVCGV